MAFKTQRPRESDIILGDLADGGINFQCQAKSIELAPDRDSGVDVALCSDGKYPYADDPTWTLTIGYFEGTDTDMASVLSTYLFIHDGEVVDFTYRPDSANATNGFSGKVMILAGTFGVEQGSTSEQSVDLPVQGQPVLLSGGTLGGGSLTAPVHP